MGGGHAVAMAHAMEFRDAFAGCPPDDTHHRRYFRRMWTLWMLKAVMERLTSEVAGRGLPR